MNGGEHTRQFGLRHILDRALERLLIVAQLRAVERDYANIAAVTYQYELKGLIERNTQ